MLKPQSRLAFEISFLILVISFFLVMGFDYTGGQVYSRMGYAWVLLAISPFFLSKESTRSALFRSLPFFLFAVFIGFEIIRFLAAVWQLQVKGMQGTSFLPLEQYAQFPYRWFLYFGFFTVSFLFFNARTSLRRLLICLAGCGLLMAVNFLPSYLLQEYSRGSRYIVNFLYSFASAHPWIGNYVTSGVAQDNISGDVITLGFFPAVGLFFYSLHGLERKFLGKGAPPVSFWDLVFSATAAFVTTLGILSFFSRGTIAAFVLAFLLFLLFILLKYPSRIQLIFTLSALLLIVGGSWWAGSLPRIWNEVRTLEKELEPATRGSFSANIEGTRRAVILYRTHPVWGVGTFGYGKFSEGVATPGTEGTYAGSTSGSLYLTVLAEEGAGAFIYFLFLLSYLSEMVLRLFKTQSSLQFFAGLCLFMGVVAVLGHASFGDLLEGFSMSMLLYILMGASLSAVRPDFKHV